MSLPVHDDDDDNEYDDDEEVFKRLTEPPLLHHPTFLQLQQQIDCMKSSSMFRNCQQIYGTRSA